MLRPMRVITLIGLVAALYMGVTTPAQGTHPRPKGGCHFRASLVPAYQACSAPNREHGPPLAFASCNPPVQTSAQATVGTPDANGAPAVFNSYIRLNVRVGVPGPPDENDVKVTVPLTDVRCLPTGARCGSPNASGPSDYTGQIRVALGSRLTDHFNSATPGGGTDPATVEDFSFEFAANCAQTASTGTGSTCNVNTSMNAVIPGTHKDTKRVVWEMGDIRIYDGGADGDGGTTADNTLFLRQGLFVP